VWHNAERVAADADHDQITYSLGLAPAGITINATTGLLSWPSPTTGTEVVTIQVTDPAGLSAGQTYNLVVSSTPPGNPPVITSTPPLNAGIGVAYAYTVTATDPQGKTISYAVSENPVVSHNNLAINPTTGAISWTPIAGELGTETLTVTATDSIGLQAVQTIRLTAWNAGGHVSSTSVIVNVSGYLKLGNLHLSFTDLTLPVSGIPITITRTYDSLNAATSSDFGYGWTLSESNYQLKVDTVNDGGTSGFGDTPPFENGTRVIVTKPDGTEEGFTFEPIAVTHPYGIIVEYYTPNFVPDPGVTDTLTVPSVDLELAFGTEYISGDGTEYNPANPEFGNTYTLTAYTGIASTFDATTGQLLTESDRHNNTLTFSPNGITSNTGRQVTFARDSLGRITSITDPNGKSIIYTYSPTTGDLVSVTDRDGNVTQFGYSPSQPHFLTQITDAFGNVVMTGQYNTSGRLTQLTNATGKSSVLSYNLTNLSESATAPGNTNPTTNTYNTEGLLTRSVDSNNNETDYTYNGMFLASKTQIVGTTDLTTTYTTNSYGQPLTETDPSNNTTYYSYDQFGDPLSQTDSMGDTTSFNYYYDPSNPNDPLNGDLLSTTDPLKSTTSFAYDNAGDVVSTTSPAGTTVNTYDQYGDLQTSTTPQGVTTTDHYDNDGNLLNSTWTWVDPNNSQNTQVMLTTNYFDNNGNLTSTVAPSGTTSSKYDADGRVYSSTDELGGVTTTLYDINGNVIKTTTPDGMVTDSVYDSQGRVIYTDDPHLPGEPANGTHTIYDQDGNVTGTERLSGLVITITTSGNNSTSAFTSDTGVLSSTSTIYDAAGRVKETIDAAGLVTNNVYDNVGNLLSSSEIVNGITRTTSSTYNVLGQVVSTTDGMNNTTHYEYNAAGQVTSTIFADTSSSSRSPVHLREFCAYSDGHH
jgi:YD repeat-containing protein